MEWTSVLLSALFAGIVATAVTVAIEKWGGLVGGLLGTVPSTIVPAGIGMYVAGGEDVLVMSMSVVPLGMLLNALFLGAWVVIPRWFPGAPYLLVLTTVGALAFWSLLGMVFLVAVDELTTYLSLQQLAASGLMLLFITAVVFNRRPQPTPKGTNRVSTLVLVARGVMAATAIGIAVGFSGLGFPTLAGLASVFPAIFLTSMVALWLAQGPTVPQGAAGPMMLGGASVRCTPTSPCGRCPPTGPSWALGSPGWLPWSAGRCLLSWCCASTTRRSTVDRSGPAWRSGDVNHLDVNKGHPFHPEQALSQGLQIQEAARAVRPGRSNGEVHLPVFGDVDVLNDVKFGVGFGVVGVSPSAQHAQHGAGGRRAFVPCAPLSSRP